MKNSEGFDEEENTTVNILKEMFDVCDVYISGSHLLAEAILAEIQHNISDKEANWKYTKSKRKLVNSGNG